jgi:hypothetical protein
MNTRTASAPRRAANALMMTLFMTAVALILLAGILSWASGNAKLAARSNQYTVAVAAAEAAAEKVNAQVASDFLNGGDAEVTTNLSSYRLIVPTSSDSSYWGNWQFSDGQGNVSNTCVLQGAISNYTVMNSAYAGLNGYATTFTLISNARQLDVPQNVTAGVMEQLQLTCIPIFQFAMYSSGDMEVSCGAPFNVSGPVHSNGELYVEPDNTLTFESSVSAVENVLFERNPLDTRAAPKGSVTYDVAPRSQQPSLTLPIGTNNTPTAIHAIIEPPASGESATSPIGRQRYYNLADMLITVSNNAVRAGSGYFNRFATLLPTNEISFFIQTNRNFYDWREQRTVRPVDIDVGKLLTWSATNKDVSSALGRNVSSIYVYDARTFNSANMGAVRLTNGQQLPPLGLTVATMDPLYVMGHFNQPSNSFLGTSNTTTCLPASLVADAITFLSTAWSDANSTAAVASRTASATTVNAALLTGNVPTTAGQYSGGMENFPRFLETWGSGTTNTYNGSMVLMFPSLIATNVWGQTNVYSPPSRNWTFDANFTTPTKLPPLTPSLQVVFRGQWATLAPNTTNVP